MSDQYFDKEVLNISVLVEGVEGANVFPNDTTYLLTDEDCNSTQYFSLLDSCNTSAILNDMSGIADLSGYNEALCTVNSEPDYFQIEDSDELFAFDIACDNDGNLQRYRYRLKMNEKGEYEGIPDSIELVPFDADAEACLNESRSVTAVEPDVIQSDTLLVKKECDKLEGSDTPDEDSNDLYVNEDHEGEEFVFVGEEHDDDDGYESCSRVKDSKVGILGQHQTLLPVNKVELVTHCKVESPTSFDAINEHINKNLCTFTDELSQNESSDIPNGIEDDETINAIESQHIFLTETHEPFDSEDRESNKNSSEGEKTDGSDNESDNDYEIVEGVHITGDSEAVVQPSFIEQQEQNLSTYVLELQQQVPLMTKKIIKFSKLNYSKNQEKENLATIPPINLVRTNPRSLLKSSYAFVEKNEIEKPEVAKIDKRFLKNKEFVQARLFNNYIAQTKILHAPVRQTRLPRKQTIKPVTRIDEEIIVQEVLVSSKGFVETHEDGVITSKAPLKPIEIVHLSDSDEDYKPKKSKTKKKLKSKKVIVEIVISDSNDEESTVENLISDSEEVPVKRGRGRPKRITETSEKTTSPIKKQKRNSTGRPANPLAIKTRWKCTSCPKVFPSQGSLKSHMQYHKFHERKYICSQCTESFTNNILLSKHAKTHLNETKLYSCVTCKKKFPTQTTLAHHKRLHIKEFMLKATDILKCSPKRTNKPPTKNPYMCQYCPSSFSTVFLVKAHEKMHMQFSCVNCTLKFPSQICLENHIRQRCVKLPKRDVSNIPCLLPKSKRATSALQTSETFKKKPSSVKPLALLCDNCTNTFTSFTALYKHNVLVHNLNTPDKRQILNESLSNTAVSKRAHSNIPANVKLRNAYAKLRGKLE